MLPFKHLCSFVRVAEIRDMNYKDVCNLEADGTYYGICGRMFMYTYSIFLHVKGYTCITIKIANNFVGDT